MRKEKNWTQQQYELAYRYMRRGFDWDFIAFNANGDWKALKAADYSFQAANYQVHGWSSDLRRKRYFEIIWRVLATSEDIPF